MERISPLGYYNLPGVKRKELAALKQKNFLLIDGHAMAYRCFYALPPLSAPDGTPTNVITGFFNMILKISKEWETNKVLVTFDAKGPTFRHESYEDYKKGRKPTPEEFKVQLPILQEMLRSFGIHVESREGVEADDVIASTALKCRDAGMNVIALSSDKDLMQILGEGISIVRPITGISKFKTYDDQAFREEFSFSPSQMPDYLALTGDKIDNVPGVPGVGEKTAKELIVRYHDLEGIKEHIDELKPGLKKKFQENLEQAFSSRELILLRTDVPIESEGFEDITPDMEAFGEMCRKLGLKQILQRTSEFWGYETAEEKEEPREFPATAGVQKKEVTLEELKKERELACCFQVTGSYPLDLELEEMVFMARDGRYWQGNLKWDTPSSVLEECLREKTLVTSDFKVLRALEGNRFPCHEKVWDLKTAHYLLHPDGKSHEINDLIPSEGSFLECARSVMDQKESLEKEIRQAGMEDLMRKVELPLIPVLVSMETHGIGLDMASMKELGHDLVKRIGEIEREIADVAQAEINLNSPKQVGWLLFEHLGLPATRKTKTGYSTNVQVLEELANLPDEASRIPRLMLEHREISKIHSGFVTPLMKSVNFRTGAVHSTFESTTTGTGRLSSRDPNLQNLPAYGNWSQRLREGLTPRSEDSIFVAADYSQVELRVLAHLSGEKRLIEAFRDERDIHTETAAWVFGVEPGFVTSELRRFAKMVNFGLLYGMSSFGLAQRLGIGRNEAAQIIDRYFGALPRVREYIEESYEEARRKGYTSTLFGRVRPLAEVTNINSRDPGALKRVVVNSPIQGTAADIAKIAMIDLDNRLIQKEKDIHLVLQVHDSLICECPRDRKEEVEEKLCSIMEKAASLTVPLKVEAKSGSSLADV